MYTYRDTKTKGGKEGEEGFAYCKFFSSIVCITSCVYNIASKNAYFNHSDNDCRGTIPHNSPEIEMPVMFFPKIKLEIS